MIRYLSAIGLTILAAVGLHVSSAAEPDKAVLDAEAKRVAVIDKVRPAVLAVCFYGGEACGSGIVIDPEGYALTNFHVVQPTGPLMPELWVRRPRQTRLSGMLCRRISPVNRRADRPDWVPSDNTSPASRRTATNVVRFGVSNPLTPSVAAEYSQ